MKPIHLASRIQYLVDLQSFSLISTILRWDNILFMLSFIPISSFVPHCMVLLRLKFQSFSFFDLVIALNIFVMIHYFYVFFYRHTQIFPRLWFLQFSVPPKLSFHYMFLIKLFIRLKILKIRQIIVFSEIMVLPEFNFFCWCIGRHVKYLKHIL